MKELKFVTVDVPEITIEETDKAGDVLLKFYDGLGWNREDFLDPRKIKTTKQTFDNLFEIMLTTQTGILSNNTSGVGLIMVDRGPSVEDGIEEGKVRLYDGWIEPLVASLGE